MPRDFYLPFFFPRLISAVGEWMSTIFHTRCGLSTNLECVSEMCCTRLAENTGRKHRHFGTIVQLSRGVSSQLRHVSTIGEKLLNNDSSSTCLQNMVNFRLLTAEMRWRVWGTPANFSGFRVLAALLRGTLVQSRSKHDSDSLPFLPE